MIIRPAVKGLKVTDPATGQPLPEEGIVIGEAEGFNHAAFYWKRREREGRVKIFHGPAPPAEDEALSAGDEALEEEAAPAAVEFSAGLARYTPPPVKGGRKGGGK